MTINIDVNVKEVKNIPQANDTRLALESLPKLDSSLISTTKTLSNLMTLTDPIIDTLIKEGLSTLNLSTNLTSGTINLLYGQRSNVITFVANYAENKIELTSTAETISISLAQTGVTMISQKAMIKVAQEAIVKFSSRFLGAALQMSASSTPMSLLVMAGSSIAIVVWGDEINAAVKQGYQWLQKNISGIKNNNLVINSLECDIKVNLHLCYGENNFSPLCNNMALCNDHLAQLQLDLGKANLVDTSSPDIDEFKESHTLKNAKNAFAKTISSMSQPSFYNPPSFLQSFLRHFIGSSINSMFSTGSGRERGPSSSPGPIQTPGPDIKQGPIKINSKRLG